MSYNNNQNKTEITYSKYAELYSEKVLTKDYNALYERPLIKNMINNVFEDFKDKTVLDCGCGSGILSRWLIDKGANVTAIDFIPKMIELTKKNTNNRAVTYAADLNNGLDFLREESFDLVFSSLVFHYIYDWYKLMQELYRILKKDGVLLFSTHHPITQYALDKNEDYHKTRLVTETWKGFAEDFTVSFYVRPLADFFKPLVSAGFHIEKFEEPLPEEKLKSDNPELYNKLAVKPVFLFIKAIK